MSKLRVQSFAISIDGYGAGPNQDLRNPLGSGEHLLQDIDMRALGYECTKYVAGERATHVFLRRRA